MPIAGPSVVEKLRSTGLPHLVFRGTIRYGPYAGQLPAPADGYGLRLWVFFPPFLFTGVTFISFSIYPSNFERKKYINKRKYPKSFKTI